MTRWSTYIPGACVLFLLGCYQEEDGTPAGPKRVVLQGHTYTVRGDLVEEYEYYLDEKQKKVLHGTRLLYPLLGGNLRYRERYIDGEMAGYSMPEDIPTPGAETGEKKVRQAPVSFTPDPESLR